MTRKPLLTYPLNILTGDLMEKIEKRWLYEQAKQEAKKAAAIDKKKLVESSTLPKEGEGNKFAGFFS